MKTRFLGFLKCFFGFHNWHYWQCATHRYVSFHRECRRYAKQVVLGHRRGRTFKTEHSLFLTI